jgi:hypothetical protein
MVVVGRNGSGDRVVVDGIMLAAELRRRRARPRSLADSVAGVSRSTWVLGDLRSAPTSLLALAALSLRGSAREGRPAERPRIGGHGDGRAAPPHDP